MKIVFALSHVGVFRHFDGVVRHLCEMGHEVQVLFSPVSKPNVTDRALAVCQRETNGACRAGLLIRRRDRWRRAIFAVRELINYAAYLGLEHPSRAHAQRWERYLPRRVRAAVASRTIRRCLATPAIQRLLRQFERLVPPDRGIVGWLRAERPDVVVASPFIFARSEEVEYVKAAKAIEIPTVVAVASWDNLTTKGVFHVIPDAVLVWNHGLVEEALRLHGVPREKLVVTGAPFFDAWFDMKPSLDREVFCRSVDVDPDRPYVAYLCSSTYIAPDEHRFVQELAEHLRQDPRTRAVNILVRPHPLNAAIWKGFRSPSVVVWPRDGEIPDVPEAKEGYYHTLYHSAAVIGLNTSAFLEAAIVDRPCIAVLAKRYELTQAGMGHFRHLLNGGFLEIAHDFGEVAAVLAQILEGHDVRVDRRRRFVHTFIRPHGLDRSASFFIASVIDRAARRVPMSASGGVSEVVHEPK